MPPTFFYMLALFNYAAIASFGLLVCLLFALSPATRIGARRVAGGILGSFPGVFTFQLLALPIAGPALLAYSSYYNAAVERTDSIPLWISVAAAALTFGLFTIASLTGFFVGWGVGARMADGMSLQRSVQASWTLSTLLRVIRLDRGQKPQGVSPGKSDV